MTEQSYRRATIAASARRARLLFASTALVTGLAWLVAGGPALAQSITVTGDLISPPPGVTDWVIPGPAMNIGTNVPTSVLIEGGATVLAPNEVVLGYNAGSSGELTVTGAGSSWWNESDMQVGREGAGTVTISNGGTGHAGGTDISTGAYGLLTVTGAGSTWTTGDLYVGRLGDGDMIVEDGGLVVTTGGAFVANSGDANVIVTGAGSVWDSSLTAMGIEGDATFNVTEGGVASFKGLLLGVYTNDATVTVTGAGSILTSEDYIDIGVQGTSTVSVANGAMINLLPFGGLSPRINIATRAGSTGVLNIGAAAGQAAVAAGAVISPEIRFGAGNGSITFNHTDTDYAFDADISGVGAMGHESGTTTFGGDSSAFAGTTTISGGRLIVANALGGTAGVTGGALQVDGQFGGNVTASGSAAISGMGTIAGNLDFTSGGALLGAAGQKLTIGGGLVLDAATNVNVSLGGPSSDGLFDVAGNLVLDGTLNVTDAGGFGGPGVYRLIDYGGTLDNQGLEIGAVPGGVDVDDLYVQTSEAAQVNLVSTAGLELSFWDGQNAGLHDNVAVNGGDGFWRADGRNWTGSDGALNGNYANPSFAVFQGAAGTVTVDHAAGAIGVLGMQFATDGYVVGGQSIELAGVDESIIRVGDGTDAGAGMTATIASSLTGNSQLVKADQGTLVLSGDNTYTGGTELRDGTLSVSANNNLGNAAGGLTFTGGTLATTASFDSARTVTLDEDGRFNVADGTTLGLSGAVAGAGDLRKLGTGTLVLTGANAYGNTVVETGTLVGNAGSISGDIGNAGTVVFDQADDASFAGAIGGLATNGTMIKRGAGEITLTGTSALDWAIEDGGVTSTTALFGGNAYIGTAGGFTFDQADNGSYTGTLSGTGEFFKSGAGMVALSADSSGFSGHTSITEGTLLVGAAPGSAALGGTLDVLSGGTLGGFGTVGTTTLHAGGIVAPGGSIGTLTVDGDFIGMGGVVEIEAELGDDSSPADRLVVTGNTSGNADVRVLNRGGTGAATVEGIKIIDVGGASDGSFALLGDYVLKGQQAVVIGAYGYTLHKNGVSTPADGDWYLRSALIDPADPTDPTDPTDPGSNPPIYQPGAPIYETYAHILQGLNGVSTLQQRVGNRYWMGAGNGGVAQGALQPSGSGENATDARGIWMRTEGSHTHFEPRISTTSSEYDLDLFQIETGIDGQFYESDAGTLIGGLTGHYGRASADIFSVFGDGSISADGYGLGATLTWYGQNGFYVDGQAKATWYNSDLASGTLGTGLADGNDGFGYAFSAETGKRIELDQNWTLTPQAQLVYSNVDFDSFTDPFGARVSLGSGDSFKARLGLAANYQTAWQDDAGNTSRTHLYGIANLYHEFLDGAKTGVAGVSFASENDRTWGGLGVGGSYNWGNDKYSLYGEVSVNTSLNDFADSYTLNGTAGFRVRF